jgi:hypothetical protein
MVFVMKDKLQLHSFSHATDDFYAHYMLFMHHVSKCMTWCSNRLHQSRWTTAFSVQWFLAGWFIVGYFFSSPKVTGVLLVGSTGCIDGMAGRSQSPRRVGD